MSRWTPTQERVMDLVYGRLIWGEDGLLVGQDPGHPVWKAPCGHHGTQMTVDPQGIITCHHEVTNRHDHKAWTELMWLTWQGGPGEYCKPPECEVVKCGRTYTEADVQAPAAGDPGR
jgi:hypothetical protein